MNQTECNENIGMFLKERILSKYRSVRQFCKQYLIFCELPHDDEEIRKMNNRFSQIINGKKGLQISDLMVVSNLLNVTCEEILTAGKAYKPIQGHLTNYEIARSSDPKGWEDYLNRADKLFLNYDEYGKSVLDYAYDFKNYPFLKYLMDNGFITFKDSSDSGFLYGYGAETSIKRRDIGHVDPLITHLNFTDTLRMNMITLAIENNDSDVLDRMYARETPMMHAAARFSNTPHEPEYYDCSRLVRAISGASDVILDYFSKEYIIKDKSFRSTDKAVFMFQHLDKVIAELIKANDKRVVRVIDHAALHNDWVGREIHNIYNFALQSTMKQYDCSKETAAGMIMELKWFHKNCSALKYVCSGATGCIASNIIRCNLKSNDSDVQMALLRLNASYDSVKALVEERN